MAMFIARFSKQIDSRHFVNDMKFKTKVFDRFRKLLTNGALDERLSSLIAKNPDSVFLRKIAPGNYLYAKGSVRICNRNGVNFALDLSDYSDWLLYFHSEVDNPKDVLSFVNTGDTILDIGGNIGQTALMMAKKAGKTGRIVSFEPYPSTIKRFERNLSINEAIDNVRLVKFGLGSEETVVRMYQDCPTNSGANRVLGNDSQSDVGIEKITVKVLDDFLPSEENLERIDFVKIDVEGYEMNVLKGAKKTLLKYKPKLFIEIDDANLKKQGSSAAELLTFLTDLSYEMTDLSNMRKISGVDEVTIHTDIFCTAKTA